MSALAISQGTEVTLHFSLKLENGDVIDSNFNAEPATFVIGDGKMLPGFERELLGLCAPVKKTFVIQPEAAFGHPQEGNIQFVKREAFGDNFDLQVGLVVNFTDASGGGVPGVVKKISEQDVVIDFNHPLAGRVIIFDVDIIDVKPSVTH